MAWRSVFACLALVTFADGRASVSPVQKVVSMLTGMVEKGKKEKHEEQVQFAAYKQFCDGTTTEKQRAIKEGNEQIEMLGAAIQEHEAEAEELSKEIAVHDEDISVWEGDLKAAGKVREIENGDYLATHKDYTESIEALEEGITSLKQQTHNVPQASTTLTQIAKSPAVSEEAKRIITAYIAQDPSVEENLAVDAPEAAAYQSHHEGMVDMLDKLVGKFEDERTEMEKEELRARQAYEMLTMDLKNQIEQATGGRTEKSEAKASALQKAAGAKGDLQDTTTTRDDDSKYLSDLSSTCASKASSFEERQKLRSEEITAIEKAIEILSSGAVAGASEKHLEGFVQKTSLAQLRSVSADPSQLRVAAYLRRQAAALDSRVLSALAMRASDDPFKKVKKMVKDLIVKLMEEANEEAEHKGWCDSEMGSNAATRKEKSEAVEMLTANIDELGATIAKTAEEITALSQAVAELDAAVAKATRIREAEKEKNAATIKDAQAAQTAVAQALSVLQEFYDKAAESTALVQQEPEIFDAPYKGMGAENGGVVGMIEVIQSDFARLEAETTAAEAEGQKEYDTFMTDSAVDKAQKSSDIEHKTAKKQNEEQVLQEKKADLAGEQKELDASLKYFEKLKPSCMDAGESYADRVARRKEEIESLQEALRIINGEDIA